MVRATGLEPARLSQRNLRVLSPKRSFLEIFNESIIKFKIAFRGQIDFTKTPLEPKNLMAYFLYAIFTARGITLAQNLQHICYTEIQDGFLSSVCNVREVDKKMTR